MPAATAYNPLDEELRSQANTERAGRIAAASKADAYYRGDHKKPLKRDPRGPDLNVIVNMFARRVRRRRDFLFLALPQIELDDDSADVNADEQWLEAAWKANRGAVKAGLMCVDGCKYGHVYVRLLPMTPRYEYPRLRLLNNVITYWSADDVGTPLWHELAWTVGETKFRQDILDLEALNLADGGYDILEYTAPINTNGKAENWILVSRERWPYPTPPIVDWQHWPDEHAYYGGSEMGDIELNDAINRTYSQGSAVIRNHAFPKTIATGVQAGKVAVATAIDSFWTIQNASAKVYNLEMQSDLSAIRNTAQDLREAYTSQGQTVEISGDPSQFARLTNLAVRTLFMDMINANNTLRNTYGHGIIQLSLAMLAMGDRKSDYEPELDWAEALPENDLEQAQVIQIERGLGIISKQSAASEMGLDWQQEQDRLDDESQGNDDLMERLITTGGAQPLALPGQPLTPNPSPSQGRGGPEAQPKAQGVNGQGAPNGRV